jgi:hypothetical protein
MEATPRANREVLPTSLIEHRTGVQRLHRPIVRLVHNRGKGLDQGDGDRDWILHDEPGHTLGAGRYGQGPIETTVVPVCWKQQHNHMNRLSRNSPVEP